MSTKLCMEANLTKIATWSLRNYFMHGYKFLNAIFTEIKIEEEEDIFNFFILCDGSINVIFPFALPSDIPLFCIAKKKYKID